uniref:U66-Sparatoxin-Hju1a_1 n=1 Tax=Heteropoda jugulans TaxID=1358901 RepID=A0A4Q8K8Y0_9ARAC
MFFALAFSLCTYVHGAKFVEATNTSTGFCNLTARGFGQIKIGETGYHDKRCEKAICEEGKFFIHTCGEIDEPDPGCTIEYEPGPYPTCCGTPFCNIVREE